MDHINSRRPMRGAAALLAIACGSCSSAGAASHWVHVPPLSSPWTPQATVVADLDGDGTDHVVALGAASHHWPFTSRLGALAAYAWDDGSSSTPVGLRAVGGYLGLNGARALATRDLPGFPGDSVLAHGCEGGAWTCVLRGRRLELAARYPMTPDPVFIGDLQGKGRHQAVSVARETNRFEIHDLASGKLDFRSAELPSSIRSIKVARLEEGSEQDLAVLVCSPCSVHVFAGGDFREKWVYEDAGRFIAVGPGSSTRDWLAITSTTDSGVIVEGGPLHVAREFVPPPEDRPSRYQLLDIDGDGSSELLAIDASHLDVIDGSSLQPRFRTRAEIDDAELAVARHPDGSRRLVWKRTTPGFPYQGLHVLAPDAGAAVQTQSAERIGAVAVGNIDANPAEEVVYLSSRYAASGWHIPVLNVLDRDSGLERWSLPLHQQYPPLQLVLLPVAVDVPDRILLAPWLQADGFSVAVVDGSTRRVAYTLGERDPGLVFTDPITAMRAGDVDGDGTPELILTSGGRLYVIDPMANRTLWHLALPEWDAELHIITHGPGLSADIVVAQENTVSMIAGTTRQIRWTTVVNENGGGNDVNCLTHAVIAETGPEVILLHNETFTYFDPDDGRILRRNSLYSYYLDDACFINAPSGRVDRLLVGRNGLRIFDGLQGHFAAWSPIWPIGDSAGALNTAHIEADPRSGRHEVVIGSMGGVSALSVFDRLDIFADGFER